LIRTPFGLYDYPRFLKQRSQIGCIYLAVFTSNHGSRLAVPVVPAEWVCDPLIMDVKWWLVVVSKTVCCYELVQFYHLDSKSAILDSSLQTVPV